MKDIHNISVTFWIYLFLWLSHVNLFLAQASHILVRQLNGVPIGIEVAVVPQTRNQLIEDTSSLEPDEEHKFKKNPKTPQIQNSPHDFVNLRKLTSSIVIDLRYATTNNFTKKVLYSKPKCYLRRVTAERLLSVQNDLQKEGLGLKVWDAYRPFSVQQKLWKAAGNKGYVTKPVMINGRRVEGSKHNRGAAVDVTLVDSRGRELEMPTDFDDFSEKARHDYQNCSPAARANREKLLDVMTRHGFEGLRTEWWHYNEPGWEKYELCDFPLE